MVRRDASTLAKPSNCSSIFLHMLLPYPRAAVAVTALRTRGAGVRQFLLAQRTKPPSAGAWMLPGGKIELGETALHAAARELREETALATSGGSALAGIWESVFPTNAEAVAVGGGEVKAHFALLFYTAEVETLPAPPQSAAPWPPRPTLQPEECDAAVWVTPGDLEVGGIRGYDAKGEPIEIEAAQIAGIYPNSIGEGIAQGNRWALETLAGC